MINKNKYDQIDYCLSVLHNYTHKIEKECYIFKPIIKSIIDVDTLKKRDFPENNIQEIFNEKIKMIAKCENKFYFKRFSNISDSTIVIGKYDKINNNYNDLNRQEMINMGYQYIFSELVLLDLFNYTMLPVMNFDIQWKNLKKTNSVIDSDIDDFEDDDMLYVNILSSPSSGKSIVPLEEFLKDTIKNFTSIHWKVLIFQVLYSLYKFAEKVKKFRHNKLNLKSIWGCCRQN